MDYNFLVFILLAYFLLTLAQDENANSISKQSWFWPLLVISLLLLVSAPCTLILAAVVHHMKSKKRRDSNESSSFESEASDITSPTPIHRQRRRRNSHECSAGRYRSPPPPYTTCNIVETNAVSPSFPPPYESPINPIVPTIALPITDNNHLNPVQHQAIDQSSVLTTQSIQTFHA